jgi:hypothetical protein
MEVPDFDLQVAEKLGVDPKEVVAARQAEYIRPTGLRELAEILSTTVKRDEPAKLITFLGMLLAQTEEDQYNIAFQAESSTGKSYIPLELVEYFPEKERREYAGASPTSFFHQMGRWISLQEAVQLTGAHGLFDKDELADKNRKVILVDLEGKILLFMDQPHWMLMEKLRPLLSHDKKLLRYDITDKTGKGGLRTKTVLLRGYSSVVFCIVKSTQEDQERTRLYLLSPETTQEKLSESLNLIVRKEGDRNAFKEWIEENPLRAWLKSRVAAIRNSGIRNVVIPNEDQVLKRFLEGRNYLKPRDQRDLPRLLRLIKAAALLNCLHREKSGPESIIASDDDIEEGFRLYGRVAESNELGLSPESYEVYEKVISPIASGEEGAPRKDIRKRYWEVYHRHLQERRLARDILPSLESAGLITEEPDPNDRRKMRVYCTDASYISADTRAGDEAAPQSSLGKYRRRNSAVHPTQSPNLQAERVTLEELRDLLRELWPGGRLEELEDLIIRYGGRSGDEARSLVNRWVADGRLAQAPEGDWKWI